MTELAELALTDRVVTRWVRRPASDVISTVERAAATAGLRLATPFTVDLDPDGRVSAQARGRVGRARVEIGVTAWSDELTEVTIRRHGRQLVAWGDRRERRYFDLAHDAASTLVA